MKKIELMQRAGLTITVLLMFVYCLPKVVFSADKQEPTAIIVDAETGKPVEGAIALAQWLRVSDKSGWFEGGRDELAKAKEVYAEAEGKVQIDDFWGAYVMSRKPSLTVYKPGYLLWHSANDGTGGCLFYPDHVFTKKNNTIRLYKFETDSTKWLQQHPDKKYPHSEHTSWFDAVTSNAPCTGSEKVTICDVFYKHEKKFAVEELTEQDKERILKNKKQ